MNLKKTLLKAIACTLIAGLMTFFLVNDITSDALLNLLLGDPDIEVIDFYNRLEAGGNLKSIDNDIVVVNIDTVFDRDELAELITEINALRPKIIGFDVILDDFKSDPGDSLLIHAICQVPNVVAVQSFDDIDKCPRPDFVSTEAPEVKRGMGNFTSNSRNGVIRTLSPQFGGDGQYPAFSTKIVSEISPSAYMELQKREGDELIKFQPKEFYVLEPSEIYNSRDMITNKIVLIGTVEDPLDLHPTALSHTYPGVMLHAHAITMMLNQDYIMSHSETYNLVLGIIFCLLLSVLYLGLGKTQNLVLRIVPILWLALILIIGWWAFNSFGLYINAPETMIWAALSLLLLDIWEACDIPLKKISTVFQTYKSKKYNEKRKI